jgi:dipeptidyl aminopeptidase/acylaminoacyl peptidase
VPCASDSLQVFAYVYAPLNAPRPLPCIVFNRGSYVRGEFAAEHVASFHRLAGAGFVVIAPMYRQSGGAGGHDEMGGADLDDLLHVAALARARPEVDADILFLYGESRGGMMVLQALRESFPARAAAVYGAFTDLGALLDSAPRMKQVANQIWPDYAARGAEIRSRRSAIEWADRIDTPLLLLRGGRDGDVSPLHALCLASRLEELGKRYELIIRADANHVMTQWRAERDAHAVEWFRRHLGGSAPASR